MLSGVPPPNKRTVWEKAGILVTQDVDSDAVTPHYSYPSIQLDPQAPSEEGLLVYPPVKPPGDENRGSVLHLLSNHVQSVLQPLRSMRQQLQRWLPAPVPEALLEGSGPLLAWHPLRSWLAATEGSSRVHVVDMSKAEGPSSNGTRSAGVVSSSRSVLAHKLMPQVLALSWAPLHPGQLAVGTLGGVALWSLAGGARPPLPGGGKVNAPWMTFLPVGSSTARVTSLAWSPDGSLLAAASPDTHGLVVWDVATGYATPVSVGRSSLSLLAWSPSGDYLFAATTGRRFFLWEATRWTHGSFDTVGPPVVSAAWHPTQPLLLLAVAGQPHLVSLHLVAQPPNLTAQLLPVLLPDLVAPVTYSSRGEPGSKAHERMDNGQGSDRNGGADAAGIAWGGRGGAASGTRHGGDSGTFSASSHDSLASLQPQGADHIGGGMSGSSSSGGGGCIQALALDPRSGSRLAVILSPPHPAAGCVALYSMSADPVVHARFIGFVRPPSSDRPPSGVRMAMHRCFGRGALLTLALDDNMMYNVPMYMDA